VSGATFEDIDPVRFVGNRSSGKMGFAVAEAAREAGAEVVLVAGPVHLDTPAGVARIDVRSAAQMHAAVLGALPADVYVGAAAVADFTPRRVSEHKIKKTAGSDTLVLELVRTPDVLADVAAHPRRPALVVGFAAETHEVEHYARGKLAAKRVDLIAANLVGGAEGGFERDDNTLAVYWRGGEQRLGPAPKREVAAQLVALIAGRLPA
jgi:phosphopantothenoylcysteine decarboxylase/phosphopantothenate--cysteine ligase